jgi:hypothetical protein
MSSSSAAAQSTTVQLNDDDVAYVMNLLRNANQPVSTQQMIDALRRQTANARTAPEDDSGDSR